MKNYLNEIPVGDEQESELTDAKIERQDFVDNEIYQVMVRLLEGTGLEGKMPKWDIELIGSVRDTIQSLLCDGDDEQLIFYPFIETEDDDDFGRGWCDFCEMSVDVDEKENCICCGNLAESL